MLLRGLSSKGFAALAAVAVVLFSAGIVISHQCHQEVPVSHSSPHVHEEAKPASLITKNLDAVGEVCIGFSLLILLAIGRKFLWTLAGKSDVRSSNFFYQLKLLQFRRLDLPLPTFSLAMPLRI
jgi:hypothetical protein